MNENDFLYSSCNYGTIPKLSSVEEIREQEAVSSNLMWYQTPSEVFDVFLKERFGYTIEEFRIMYLRKHLANLGFDEDNILGTVQFVHPIPENIAVYVEEVNSLLELMFKYKEHKELIKRHSCGNLPLHNSQTCTFWIIRAKFSQKTSKAENLEMKQNDPFFGYYCSDKKFKFLISSSNQLDLTVIYEEL